MKDKNLGRRIWAGDPESVARARQKYEADPEGGLVPLAVALYSFRANKEFAKELLVLCPEVTKRAQRALLVAAWGNHTPELSDEVDVLSTHLAWMSRQRELGEDWLHYARTLAHQLCEKGPRLTAKARLGHHTRELIRLTHAELLFADDQPTAARALLRAVERAVVLGITDRRQRARMMRKLGALCRRHVHWGRGVYWGVRACLVWRIPLAVRVKSIVALVGIER